MPLRASAIACLLVLTAALGAAEPDPLDRALGRLGLDRAQCRPDPAFLANKPIGSGRLAMVEAWLAAPLRIPLWQRELRDRLFAGAGAARPLVEQLGGMLALEAAAPPTLATRWLGLAGAADGLEQAVRELDAQAAPASAAALPPALRRSATILLACCADLQRLRDQALQRLDAAERVELYATLSEPLDALDGGKTSNATDYRAPAALQHFQRTQELLGRIDLAPLLVGANALAQALVAAEAELSALPAGTAGTWSCATALGEIRLGSPGADHYDDRPWLLVIDSGGDDSYASGGASCSATQPIGLLIDRAGNDRYSAAAGRPAWGAGVMGWGVLIDQGGDDSYQAAGFFAQGAAVVGCGWLDDRAGNDRYQVAGGGQGFATHGVAWLVDHVGDDRFDTIIYAQGCGRPRGVGLLFDIAGHDTYVADDTTIVVPSAQSPQHNASCAQGAGFGRRRDGIDGRSLAGGIGLLLDGGGDDSYSAGVYGQAIGYWHGIGILDDRAGNDRYRGVWYAQSATAHFGVSCLVDGGGDDLYDSVLCMGVAAGHDVGVSLFIEESGNDTYRGGSNCGAGLHQGLGLCVDLAGDDTYQAGSFGSARHDPPPPDRTNGAPTIGIFLDLGGRDTYPGGSAGENRHWQQAASAAGSPRLLGTGEDGVGTLRWGE